MKKPQLSPNAAHAGTVAVLAAAAELGAEAIEKCLGTDEVSTQVGDLKLTTHDIQVALLARMANKLGA